MEIRLEGESDWRLVPATRKGRTTRGGQRGAERGGSGGGKESRETVAQDVVPPEFLSEETSVALVTAALPRPRRGSLRETAISPIDASVDVDPGESAVIVARHPSGALTFHPPIEPPSQTAPTAPRRGGETAAASGPRRLHFRVEMAEGAPVRREAVIAQAIKLAVVKVAKAAVDKVVAKGVQAAGRVAEARWWKKKGLKEGWYRLRMTGGTLALEPVARVHDGEGPALLFLHGTFSNLAGSFAKLLTPAVFDELRTRYGDRIYGFEHFSVSRSPEENVQALLQGLPDRETVFDMVGYSRGGLLLRTLAELPASAGPLARRFTLGRAVLVAVPNGGTPLATGARWENTLGLVANITDALPDNPWTMAADFVASGIVWLASHASADLPGLAAMDGNGAMVKALREGDGPSAGRYSAIGANHHPDAALWRRLVDAGIDSFFASANDLVVPTDGAWQITPLARDSRALTADRVACFGFDGNLQPGLGTVHHLNVLGQAETARFITRALAGDPQELTPLDLSQPRKSRQIWRGRAAAGILPGTAARETAPAAPVDVEPSEAEASMRAAASEPDIDHDGTLHLMVLRAPRQKDADGRRTKSTAHILAMYGGARVREDFPLHDVHEKKKHDEAGTRFSDIIDSHETIRRALDGTPDPKTGAVPELPNSKKLRAFGKLLFEALFTRRVRRLYDLARTQQRQSPLNVVFTCEIPWVAAKPWEFVFDPDRQKYLATEEINFVRNVFTAVPAQAIPRRERLRMLMVQAQPSGTAVLSIADEEQRIRHRFEALIRAGLVEIDVLARVTAERLHRTMVASVIQKNPYDIVHFIGHGEFSPPSKGDDGQGQLLFHGDDGGTQRIGIRTLREILCNRGVQIVFLNACDTARDSRHKGNRGAAQALMEGGLPAVVANQYPVLDPSAVTFANSLYWAIAQGASLGEAAREARIAVNYSVAGEPIDWAVPVVYARDPNYRPYQPDTRKGPSKVESYDAPRPVSKDAPERKRISVGVADLASFFPELSSVLRRLNDVQKQFEFREVKVAAPLGVWDKDPDRFGDKRFLNAPRLAERIKGHIGELGVDYLACITNWWMHDDETWNLYGWWSEKIDLPVLVFSTEGLALPTRGPAAGRTVANMLASTLAARLVQVKEPNADVMHSAGPASCPFFRNNDRKPEVLAARLTFDPTCRARLERAADKDTLAAIEAMLAAYDA